MQDRLLKKIISELTGQEAEKLVDLLYKKQNVNEFLIAKRLNLTINQTRNMLYRLADEGLIQFIRKKDKKKGGWYTYFWTLQTKRSLLKYREKINSKIEAFNKELQILESEAQYYCPTCEAQYNQEAALLNDYSCPECGVILKIKETSDLTAQIRTEIKKIEDFRAQIDVEVAEIESKEQKTKEKRIKEEIKQKEIERKKKREERARAKKKEQKSAAPKKKETKKKSSPKKIKKDSKKKK
jgi:transcription factor E